MVDENEGRQTIKRRTSKRLSGGILKIADREPLSQILNDFDHGDTLVEDDDTTTYAKRPKRNKKRVSFHNQKRVKTFIKDTDYEEHIQNDRDVLNQTTNQEHEMDVTRISDEGHGNIDDANLTMNIQKHFNANICQQDKADFTLNMEPGYNMFTRPSPSLGNKTMQRIGENVDMATDTFVLNFDKSYGEDLEKSKVKVDVEDEDTTDYMSGKPFLENILGGYDEEDSYGEDLEKSKVKVDAEDEDTTDYMSGKPFLENILGGYDDEDSNEARQTTEENTDKMAFFLDNINREDSNDGESPISSTVVRSFVKSDANKTQSENPEELNITACLNELSTIGEISSPTGRGINHTEMIMKDLNNLISSPVRATATPTQNKQLSTPNRKVHSSLPGSSSLTEVSTQSTFNSKATPEHAKAKVTFPRFSDFKSIPTSSSMRFSTGVSTKLTDVNFRDKKAEISDIEVTPNQTVCGTPQQPEDSSVEVKTSGDTPSFIETFNNKMNLVKPTEQQVEDSESPVKDKSDALPLIHSVTPNRVSKPMIESTTPLRTPSISLRESSAVPIIHTITPKAIMAATIPLRIASALLDETKIPDSNPSQSFMEDSRNSAFVPVRASKTLPIVNTLLKSPVNDGAENTITSIPASQPETTKVTVLELIRSRVAESSAFLQDFSASLRPATPVEESTRKLDKACDKPVIVDKRITNEALHVDTGNLNTHATKSTVETSESSLLKVVIPNSTKTALPLSTIPNNRTDNIPDSPIVPNKMADEMDQTQMHGMSMTLVEDSPMKIEQISSDIKYVANENFKKIPSASLPLSLVTKSAGDDQPLSGANLGTTDITNKIDNIPTAVASLSYVNRSISKELLTGEIGNNTFNKTRVVPTSDVEESSVEKQSASLSYANRSISNNAIVCAISNNTFNKIEVVPMSDIDFSVEKQGAEQSNQQTSQIAGEPSEEIDPMGNTEQSVQQQQVEKQTKSLDRRRTYTIEDLNKLSRNSQVVIENASNDATAISSQSDRTSMNPPVTSERPSHNFPAKTSTSESEKKDKNDRRRTYNLGYQTILAQNDDEAKWLDESNFNDVTIAFKPPIANSSIVVQRGDYGLITDDENIGVMSFQKDDGYKTVVIEQQSGQQHLNDGNKTLVIEQLSQQTKQQQLADGEKTVIIEQHPGQTGQQQQDDGNKTVIIEQRQPEDIADDISNLVHKVLIDAEQTIWKEDESKESIEGMETDQHENRETKGNNSTRTIENDMDTNVNEDVTQQPVSHELKPEEHTIDVSPVSLNRKTPVKVAPVKRTPIKKTPSKKTPMKKSSNSKLQPITSPHNDVAPFEEEFLGDPFTSRPKIPRDENESTTFQARKENEEKTRSISQQQHDVFESTMDYASSKQVKQQTCLVTATAATSTKGTPFKPSSRLAHSFAQPKSMLHSPDEKGSESKEKPADEAHEVENMEIEVKIPLSSEDEKDSSIPDTTSKTKDTPNIRKRKRRKRITQRTPVKRKPKIDHIINTIKKDVKEASNGCYKIEKTTKTSLIASFDIYKYHKVHFHINEFNITNINIVQQIDDRLPDGEKWYLSTMKTIINEERLKEKYTDVSQIPQSLENINKSLSSWHPFIYDIYKTFKANLGKVKLYTNKMTYQFLIREKRYSSFYFHVQFDVGVEKLAPRYQLQHHAFYFVLDEVKKLLSENPKTFEEFPIFKMCSRIKEFTKAIESGSKQIDLIRSNDATVYEINAT